MANRKNLTQTGFWKKMKKYCFVSLGNPKGHLDMRALLMSLKLSPNLMVPLISESGVHFQTDFPPIRGKITTGSTSLSMDSNRPNRRKLSSSAHTSGKTLWLAVPVHMPTPGPTPGPACWVLWLSSKDRGFTEQIFRSQQWERRKILLASIIKADIDCICSLDWSLSNSWNNCPYNLWNNFFGGYHCGLWYLSPLQFSYNIQRKKKMGTESSLDIWACWLLPLDIVIWREVRALSCCMWAASSPGVFVFQSHVSLITGMWRVSFVFPCMCLKCSFTLAPWKPGRIFPLSLKSPFSLLGTFYLENWKKKKKNHLRIY